MNARKIGIIMLMRYLNTRKMIATITAQYAMLIRKFTRGFVSRLSSIKFPSFQGITYQL